MTFDVRAQLLLDNANWERKLTQASKQMAGFGKSMKTISNGVKAAWAGVAAMGVGAVYDAIVDVTKAAAMDAKSTELLNKQMANSWKATQKTKDEMGLYVDQISNMTGILDDNLRPALASIVRVTKGPTKAMKAFNQVLDISAGTGKDVNTVAKAYSKYLAGNEGALAKLVPGLKEAGNGAEFLKTQFGGMAELAGQKDPFARINAVMDNFKEKLGAAFLPVANDIADWLASPEAQKALDDIAKKVQDAFAWLTSPEGKKQMREWFDTFLVLIKGAMDLATQVANLIGAEKVKSSNLTSALGTREGRNALNFLGGGQASGTMGLSNAESLTKSSTGNMSTANGITTVNIYGTVSGNDVVKALKNIAGQKGMTLGRLLR
jgi:hypothetical protein